MLLILLLINRWSISIFRHSIDADFCNTWTRSMLMLATLYRIWFLRHSIISDFRQSINADFLTFDLFEFFDSYSIPIFSAINLWFDNYIFHNRLMQIFRHSMDADFSTYIRFQFFRQSINAYFCDIQLFLIFRHSFDANFIPIDWFWFFDSYSIPIFLTIHLFWIVRQFNDVHFSTIDHRLIQILRHSIHADFCDTQTPSMLICHNSIFADFSIIDCSWFFYILSILIFRIIFDAYFIDNWSILIFATLYRLWFFNTWSMLSFVIHSDELDRCWCFRHSTDTDFNDSQSMLSSRHPIDTDFCYTRSMLIIDSWSILFLRQSAEIIN